jgi:hypothetical protein
VTGRGSHHPKAADTKVENHLAGGLDAARGHGKGDAPHGIRRAFGAQNTQEFDNQQLDHIEFPSLSELPAVAKGMELSVGATDYAAWIYRLSDTDLERLTDDWVASMRRRYPDSDRFSGAGDMGRDVVGYRSTSRFDGLWDNYQCKQLLERLGDPEFIREIGKIFHHSSAGHFNLPAHFYFIAPRGAVRNVRALIGKPSSIGPRLIEKWDDWCAGSLVEKQTIALSSDVRASIEGYDFRNVSLLEAGKLVRDDAMKAVLVKWFDADPGAAPVGSVPAAVQPEEARYVSQLFKAYGERGAPSFASSDEALVDPVFGDHFRVQRQRYFDAASFKRYYRDSTEPAVLKAFDDDMYHGVFDTHGMTHDDTMAKIAAVMNEAKSVAVSGVLGKYARVPVKQGTIHHFANDDVLPWVK